MNSASVKALTMATVVASGFLFGSLAFAAPSVSSPEMVKALAKAKEGPTELRRFVQLTKAIYGLDYFEVMSIHEARKALASEKPVVARVERE